MFIARHLIAQRRVLAALGGTVVEAAGQRLGLAAARPAPVPPSHEVMASVPAPGPGLVRDFIRHVGGDPAAWRGQLPPHLFPQWTVPVAARTLRGLPYPLLEVVNGGCKLQINAPLPEGRPLVVRARLESIDDDGRRAVLRQRVTTGTSDQPEALVADLFVIVPTQPRRARKASPNRSKDAGPRKEPARVPWHARELGFWRLPADAGLSFAVLTGDLNPIHWVKPYARAAGFRSPILHGFSTMARAMEGLIRGLFAGRVDRLASLDVRFVRPLALPARVGLYVCGQEIFVGDAPGGPAYLTGSFTERAS